MRNAISPAQANLRDQRVVARARRAPLALATSPWPRRLAFASGLMVIWWLAWGTSGSLSQQCNASDWIQNQGPCSATLRAAEQILIPVAVGLLVLLSWLVSSFVTDLSMWPGRTNAARQRGQWKANAEMLYATGRLAEQDYREIVDGLRVLEEPPGTTRRRLGRNSACLPLGMLGVLALNVWFTSGFYADGEEAELAIFGPFAYPSWWTGAWGFALLGSLAGLVVLGIVMARRGKQAQRQAWESFERLYEGALAKANKARVPIPPAPGRRPRT